MPISDSRWFNFPSLKSVEEVVGEFDPMPSLARDGQARAPQGCAARRKRRAERQRIKLPHHLPSDGNISRPLLC